MNSSLLTKHITAAVLSSSWEMGKIAERLEELRKKEPEKSGNGGASALKTAGCAALGLYHQLQNKARNPNKLTAKDLLVFPPSRDAVLDLGDRPCYVTITMMPPPAATTEVPEDATQPKKKKEASEPLKATVFYHPTQIVVVPQGVEEPWAAEALASQAGLEEVAA